MFFIYNLFHYIDNSWLIYIFANVFQFIAVISLGIFYRRKNINLVYDNKYVSLLICSGLCISVLLHVLGFQEKLFLTITYTLRIYDILANNLFFSILWDQLFNNYLITNFLICSAIVFVKNTYEYKNVPVK